MVRTYVCAFSLSYLHQMLPIQSPCYTAYPTRVTVTPWHGLDASHRTPIAVRNCTHQVVSCVVSCHSPNEYNAPFPYFWEHLCDNSKCIWIVRDIAESSWGDQRSAGAIMKLINCVYLMNRNTVCVCVCVCVYVHNCTSASYRMPSFLFLALSTILISILITLLSYFLTPHTYILATLSLANFL